MADGDVLPRSSDPREWIVCLYLGVVIAFSIYTLRCPLPPRRTRVMDLSGISPTSESGSPPRVRSRTSSPSTPSSQANIRPDTVGQHKLSDS